MAKTSIDITDEAMASINRWVGKRGGRGMRKHALSKLVQWFGEQPDSFKSITTGMVDEDMRADYAKALRRMANQVEGNQPTGVGEPWREVNPSSQSPECDVKKCEK